MSNEPATSDQRAERSAWRAEFFRMPKPLDWLVIAGVLLVAYMVFLAPEMDTGKAESQRILKQLRQMKSGHSERPEIAPDKSDSRTDSR